MITIVTAHGLILPILLKFPLKNEMVFKMRLQMGNTYMLFTHCSYRDIKTKIQYTS